MKNNYVLAYFVFGGEGGTKSSRHLAICLSKIFCTSLRKMCIYEFYSMKFFQFSTCSSIIFHVWQITKNVLRDMHTYLYIFGGNIYLRLSRNLLAFADYARAGPLIENTCDCTLSNAFISSQFMIYVTEFNLCYFCFGWNIFIWKAPNLWI